MNFEQEAMLKFCFKTTVIILSTRTDGPLQTVDPDQMQQHVASDR